MESLHYLLMKSHGMLSHKVLSEASKIGLTAGQPKVLDFLLKYQEADQKTIASYCEIEPATAGSILLRMENSGLVLRRQKNGNRRSLYVSLTDSGFQAASQMSAIFLAAETEVTQLLSPSEVKNLKELLTKICLVGAEHEKIWGDKDDNKVE